MNQIVRFADPIGVHSSQLPAICIGHVNCAAYFWNCRRNWLNHGVKINGNWTMSKHFCPLSHKVYSIWKLPGKHQHTILYFAAEIQLIEIVFVLVSVSFCLAVNKISDVYGIAICKWLAFVWSKCTTANDYTYYMCVLSLSSVASSLSGIDWIVIW